jgi:hypothetical protein
MALNFGLLDTNLPGQIAGSVQRGQDEALRNQMAQQQLKTSAMQQESAQMQLEQAKRERDSLAKLQATFVANGKSPDMRANFQEMMQSGIPHFMDIGLKGMQALERQANVSRILGGGEPTGAPAPAGMPAPAAAPASSIMRQPAPAPAEGALGTGTYGMTPTAPTNALAPAAYKPPVPRNALALPAGEQAAMEKEYRIIEQLHMAGEHELAKSREQRLKLKSEATSPLNKLIMEKAALLPGDPMHKIYEARILKEATHAPPVSVSMTQEKAEAADYGKFLVDQFKNVSKASDLAQKSMPAIESNLTILGKGFDTGFGTETKAAGAKVLAALGVKDADKYATDAQTFLSNANAAVLQKQLEQKGPQTESDAQRITATGAQLGNTKDANKFVLNVAKAQLQRDIDQRNFYANWRSKAKTLEGAEDAWNAGPGSKSLFERPELKAYINPTSAASQIPGQNPVPSMVRKTTPAANVVTNPQFPGFSIGKP